MEDPAITERLRSATVGIAGAGGLGSNAAIALARAGVGSLVIVDFDRVEESNLNRQYYYPDQIGDFKVDALKMNIEKAVPACGVKAINRKLEKGRMTEPFSDVDIIVEALDSAVEKVQLIEEALAMFPEKPIVAASGVAGIGGGERLKLIRSGNLFLVQDPESKSSDEEICLAPKVGMMAYYQANIVLELILGGKTWQ